MCCPSCGDSSYKCGCGAMCEKCGEVYYTKEHVCNIVSTEEYLRRNLLVAKAIGARGNAEVGLKRLKEMKRPPKWMIALLEGIQERAEPLPKALAHYRNLAKE